jgi:hypothetical protein
MSNARYQQDTQATVGDGNCAFNAFALRLFSKEVLPKIEKNFPNPDLSFNAFINHVAQQAQISITNWQELKAQLLGLDKIALQKAVAPALRELAIDLLQGKPQTPFLNSQAALAGALDVYEKDKNARDAGDIFLRHHAFIRAKFDEILNLSLLFPVIDMFADDQDAIRQKKIQQQKFIAKLDMFCQQDQFDLAIKEDIENLKQALAVCNSQLEQSTAIVAPGAEKLFSQEENRLADAFVKIARKVAALQWWDKQGYKQFLQAMRMPINGGRPKDAGYLELAPLGEYFGVTICARKKGVVKRTTGPVGSDEFSLSLIHNANGELSSLSEPERRELMARGVLQGNKLASMSLACVTARLNAVPQYSEVMEVIKTQPKQGANVPTSWTQATLKELQARGIVVLREQGYQFAINVNKETCKARLGAMSNQAAILQAWQEAYHDAPVVVLQNLEGVHWEAVLPKGSVNRTNTSSTYENTISEEVRLANNAVSEIADVIEENFAALNQSADTLFQKAFDSFSQSIVNPHGHALDAGFFAAKKQAIITEIKSAVEQSHSQFKLPQNK